MLLDRSLENKDPTYCSDFIPHERARSLLPTNSSVLYQVCQGNLGLHLPSCKASASLVTAKWNREVVPSEITIPLLETKFVFFARKYKFWRSSPSSTTSCFYGNFRGGQTSTRFHLKLFYALFIGQYVRFRILIKLCEIIFDF